MKKVLLLMGLFVALLSAPTYAQNHGKCGVTHEQGLQLKQRMLNNRKASNSNAETRGGDTKYLPVKVHLVGLDDEPSPVPGYQVLDMLCILNAEWEPLDIQFYLSGEINHINSTRIANHENYDTQFGPAVIWEEALDHKVNDAINVFVTNNVGSSGGGGTTLAYYIEGQNYKYDFIMIRRASMYGASVLPHEMGHLFSLSHPFLGWEGNAWNEGTHGLQVGPTSPGNTPNERVNDPNCATVADGMCDTPPDYLFGFHSSQSGGCSPFNQGTMDPDGVVINPMENNTMSYFENCTEYEFTDDQVDAVYADLATNARNYLDPGTIPNLEEITESPTLVSPINGAEVPFNSVWLTWEPVEGADGYVVEVGPNGSFSPGPYYRTVTTTSTSAVVEDLLANASVPFSWRVRPYGEYELCTAFSDVAEFNTNAIETSVQNVQGLNGWNLRPNPAIGSDVIFIDAETTNILDATINVYSAAGQLISSLENNFDKGTNTIEIPTNNMSAGIYMVSIQTETGVTTKRLVIR
ncbi:MAG: T9SS type A sorting domain-containing protein [Saprospiraceae bacterium]